ncbi:MAG TPA: acetyl-CoA hydrolase/transferase C-terminal domain-containing protein, partial [bacterium]|nr:acetyl-CoA hydrolase/transferase C-terminal domain-containing protein [bacterium]
QHLASTLIAPDLCDCVQTNAWFVSGAVRNLVKVGLVHYVPAYFHQIPRLIRDYVKPDVVVTMVSPMDAAGYFSFGSGSYIIDAARTGKHIIVEVNRHLPRVFGDSLIHVSEVHAIVEHHAPLPDATIPDPRPEDAVIGERIAGLIPDAAVLQLGIGGLPNALCGSLRHHRDLGVHSELIGPGMVELIRAGVITGRKKNYHPHKHLFCMPYGTADTFAHLNDNPAMEAYSAEYIMDPNVIARNDRMVAINSIIEVDLTGQCNAESIDGSQFSGTGGQLDFIRGAYASRGGVAILAFYATAKSGTVSRVVPVLPAGAAVTTPRMDVHYLVTEYGAVNLKGISSAERAKAIVSLAHPQFRDDLLRAAEEMNLF